MSGERLNLPLTAHRTAHPLFQGRILNFVDVTCGMTICDERCSTSSAFVCRAYPPVLVSPRFVYVTVPSSPVTRVESPRISPGVPLLLTGSTVTFTPPTGIPFQR